MEEESKLVAIKPQFDGEIKARIKSVGEIESNMKEVKTYVENLSNYYKNVSFTDETMKEAIEEKAKINKFKEEVAKYRKNIVCEYNKPIKGFEDTSKETEQLLKQAYEVINTQVSNYRDKQKKIIEEEVKSYFEEYKQNLNIDFVKFEDANISITLTASKKSLQKQVQDFIDRINVDLATIALQNNNDEILVEYKTNGYKLNEAMQTVAKRLKSIEEEKKKQEEIANKRLVSDETKVEEIHTTVDSTLQLPIREEKNDQKIVHIEMNENHEITKESYEELEDVFSKPLEQPNVEIKKDEEKFTIQFKVKHETKERIKKIQEFLDREGYDYE